MNLALILIVTLLTVAGIFYFLRKRGDSEEDAIDYSLDSMVEFANDMLHEECYGDPDPRLPDTDYMNFIYYQTNLIKHKDLAPVGNIGSKKYLKSVFRSKLAKAYKLTDETMNLVIPFDKPLQLTTLDKFDILLHHYKKIKGRDAFVFMLEDNNLLNLFEDKDGKMKYKVTADDIEDLYLMLNPILDYDDKLDIITQRVYQKLNLGVIDELRDQRIDGINCGVAGLTPVMSDSMEVDNLYFETEGIKRCWESTWVIVGGKYVYLSFLGFESEKEMARVAQLVYTFGNPGQLTESNGFKVNDMSDGSRVLVIRPPTAESWAFFIRKFDNVQRKSLGNLIKGNNSKLMVDTITYLMKAIEPVIYTGSQGSGKTTLMIAALAETYFFYSMRIHELSFELRMRSQLPESNILTMRPTGNISGQSLINASKKMDSIIAVIGEIADANTSSFGIQASKTGFESMYASHHGKNVDDMLTSLGMDMVQAKIVTDLSDGVRLVVSAVKTNIHMHRAPNGDRYPVRVSEITETPRVIPYDRSFLEADTTAELMHGKITADLEFYEKVTDRSLYVATSVVVYDAGSFVPGPMFSHEKISRMWDRLLPSDKEGFKEYLQQWWPQEFQERNYETTLVLSA